MPRPRQFPELTPIRDLTRRVAILEGKPAGGAGPGGASDFKTLIGPDLSDFWEMLAIDGGDSLVIRQWDDSASAFLERFEIVGKGTGLADEGDIIFYDLDGVEIFRFDESLDRIQYAAGRGKVDFAGGSSELSSLEKIHSFGADITIQAESTGDSAQDLRLEADDAAGAMRTRIHIKGAGDIEVLKVDGTTPSKTWNETANRWEYATRPFSTADSELLEVEGHTHTGLSIKESIVFNFKGDLMEVDGELRWYPPYDITITDVRISVGTAPTGSTIEVDVNNGGTTIFTTQSLRPIIATSGFFDLSGTPNGDVTLTADTDYITVDIDQVGSTIAGRDLVVTILATQD